jgi:CRISPR/Cas system endoribonuclease Cas6 (RAMP superfamily)
MGNVDIDLSQHQELWAYLYLGQWLGVGKNASMGFGQYRLVTI